MKPGDAVGLRVRRQGSRRGGGSCRVRRDDVGTECVSGDSGGLGSLGRSVGRSVLRRNNEPREERRYRYPRSLRSSVGEFRHR